MFSQSKRNNYFLLNMLSSLPSMKIAIVGSGGVGKSIMTVKYN
jgi:GTPase SAR1 family protein